MISRTYTRKTLQQTLYKFDKGKNKIDYPMAEFRHAIMDCASKCRGLIDCKWTFDTKDKLTVCILLFRTKKIICTYNFSTGKVDIDEYQKTDECGEILVSGKECTCEELSYVVSTLQPKCRIIKRKN